MMNSNEGSTSNNLFKQKRDEYVVSIRKKKNVDHISLKRVKFAQAGFSENDTVDETDTLPIPPMTELAAKFMEAFQNGNVKDLPIILKFIRRAVSFDEDPPVVELVHTGIVPHIVELLSQDYYGEERIITEASWIAVNIVSKESTHVNFMVSLEIIPIALRLLSYPSKAVQENSLYILANIAGDSTGYRNAILDQGVADILDAFAEKGDFDVKMISNVAWLISNLCGANTKKSPPYEMIAPFMRYIQNFLATSTNEETLLDCMWSLEKVTRGGASEIDEVIQMEMFEDIFKCLRANSEKLKVVTLRTIGNMLTEEDEQMQTLMNRGVIEAVFPLLQDSSKSVKTQACFVCSNLLSGTADQVKEVIDWNDGIIIKTLMEIVNRDHPDVSQQALIALCNACDSANTQETTYLVKLGIIELIVENVKIHNDYDIVNACVAALDNVLKEGDDMMMGTDPHENPFYVKLLECDGMTEIERLQNFANDHVFAIVSSILDRYRE